MSIHSNTSYHTAIAPSNLDGNHPSTNVDKRVEGVTFDILYSQAPFLDKDAEQIRFKLEEHVKTGSQPYTIVTWNDKKYRITVHINKSQISCSERDWKRLGDNLKTKIWDKAHPGEHFSKGALKLTDRKWRAELKNPIGNSNEIARFVSKKVIREFKNLFEKQIEHLNRSRAAKASSTQQNNISSTPPNRKNLSEAAQEKKENAFNKLIEKFNNCVSAFLKKANKQNTVIDQKEEKSVFEQSRQFLAKTKNHFFPTHKKEEFDDLTSETTSLFEEISDIPKETGFDLISDTTSIGGISEITDILEDQGLPYSPKINRR